MGMSIAIRKPQLSIRGFVFLVALLATFLLGGAGGYLVKAVTAVPVASVTRACPVGSHPVVWYTAHSWSCAADG
jgi:hypothetical protein